MKTKLLIGAALLFSVASFAQSRKAVKQDKNRDNHGTSVSAVAHSETELGTKGEAVSSAASVRAQAEINRQNATPEERAERKAARKAAHEAKRQEQEDFVADVKARAEARTDENLSTEAKAAIEARKALLKENKEEARAARAAAKAERKSADNDLLGADASVKVGNADKASAKGNRPAKVKAGAGANTDVQLHRPKVGARVRGTAGLGIL